MSSSRPNEWAREILSATAIRHDWLTCLLYDRIARHFSNSREAVFGTGKCWSVALTEVVDFDSPDFKGVFLTEKRGLGFLGCGRQVRFHQGVMFLGTRQFVVEGIDIHLQAVGLDRQGSLVFIVTGDYLSKCGVPQQTVSEERLCLKQAGAVLCKIEEALESDKELTLLWTVPASQLNPQEPRALESFPPSIAGLDV